MNRTTRLLFLTAVALLALTASTFALFTNGGFEAGDFSGGWVKSTFFNTGLTGAQPFSGSSIVRGAGGSDQTTVVGPGATPLSLADPLAPAVLYPRFGQYSGRVNYIDGATTPNRNANSMLQQAVVGPGDIDGFDNLVHIRFAFLPVLEDGNHSPSQQAYFYIGIRNVTKGTLLWERFTFANEPGVPWQSSGLYRYTDWQLVDASGGPGVVDVGDTIQLEVIGAGCNQGGHRGHVYVDAFGSSIPGGTVVATAPVSVNAGAPLTYDFHVVNGGGANLENPVISITMPPQTTFASVDDVDCSHAAGVVTCHFADFIPGATRDFQVTVNSSATASGTITLGAYSVAGTAYPALLGPIRTTTVINTVPVGVADGYSVAEDGSLTVSGNGVLANDSDPEGNPLTAVLITGPAHGTLNLNADGSVTYTPTANYNGPDTVVYRASDGVNQSPNTTVSITVTAVPDPPIPSADSFSVAEDGVLVRNAAQGVRANDTDADGDVLTIALVGGVSHGSLSLNSDGSFTYTPTANYFGPDGFTYTASDSGTTVGPVAVTLGVTAVNDAPTGVADGYSTAEDAPLTVTAPGVLANDTDVEASPLTAVLVTGPAHGTLSLNADGSFTYTPDANYNGPDSFVYRANDGTAPSANTTVSLTVTAVPDPPTASNDGGGGTFAINEDGTLTVTAPGVLGNDVDPDGDPLTAALVSGPAHGTLTLNPDGSFVYTPAADYAGPDSFTYTVSDGSHSSAPATVTLAVNPVNDPPTAAANTYSLGEDHTISVPAASGVLANDNDLDPSTTLTAILVAPPAHGALTLNADGSFTYTPAANFNGVDTFTYLVSDGTATSAPVTVTLNVGDDVLLTPGAGRFTGGTRVTVEGSGFGPAGTPVTVTIGGVPALEAEVVDDTHITFVTPALPANTPVDVVVVVNNGAPENLPGAYLPLPVPAAGSTVDTDGDGITDEVELRYGLDPTDPADAAGDPDHDGVPSNTEITLGTHPTAPYLRYFAEGINNAVFNTGIAVANASAATNEVQLTFFRQGQAPVHKNLTLAGKTRVILNTATVAGMADAAFGVEIAGNEAVTADRTTFWDLGGREAHSEHAVESSPTWYFAEGATTGRFTLFYLLTNPGSQPANATVTFLRQVGAPIVKQVVIPGYARLTIPVNTADPGLASADLGGVVTADRPIVAERSMYLSSPTKIWEAGSGGTGVTAPANRWFFGEGATGSFFDAWILLSNPGTADATVTIRYVADSGADVTRTHTVPAGRRTTVRVVDEDPAMMNTSFATFVTSTNAVPVVAERAMWWRADEGYWTAGHVGVGFTEGGKKWVTADGVAAADGSSDTYALVSNTENRPGLLKVTALFSDGTAPVERMFAIGANQRFTIRGRQRFPEVVGKGYSFVIESVGATPVDIVVDHSTYYDLDGRFWAMGTTSPGSKIR